MTKLSTEDILKEKKATDPSSIASLTLTHKALTNVSCLGDFKNLERLDLTFNNLTSLKGLELCVNLKWLSVQQNKLQSLNGIEGLTNLSVLNAGKNKLRSMDEVRNLLKLRALILNDNEIATISGLDELKELNTLVLSRNPIRKMGNSLAKLKSISKISLSNCQLEAIDSSIRGCIGLEQLRLAHNDIKGIPHELGNNKKLQILDLGNNMISKWSDLEALSSLRDLKNINLHGNPIAEKAKLVKKISKLVPSLQILNAKRMDKFNKVERVKEASIGAKDDSTPQKKKKRVHEEKIMSNDSGPDDKRIVDSDKLLNEPEQNKSREPAKENSVIDDTNNMVKGKSDGKSKGKKQKKHSKIEETSRAGEEELDVGNDRKNEDKQQKKKKEKHKKKEAQVQEPEKTTDKRSKRKAEKVGIDAIDDKETPFSEIFAYDGIENMKLNDEKRRDDRAAGNIDSISALVTYPSKKKKAKNQRAGANVLQFSTPAAEVGLGGPSAWDNE